MRFSAAALLSSVPLIAAQTYTNCNPLHTSCPPDPALGKSASFDFTKGASDQWTPSGGTPTYDSSKGAAFTIAKQGDAPLITSKFYIMFGHVEYVIQAAPGTGIVSSAVLQSDDLDEIDWEWLGGDDSSVQTNYFGKGDTSTYNRAATYSAPNNHDGFHTYAIDWTADHIVWQIDGTTVRTLTPETADTNQYPQTPMMIKVGIWAGGDPSNPQGTIQWAGGVTQYDQGPFTMYVKSISVTDYSTGSQYKYTDESGTWESIEAVGGKVNGNSGAAVSVATSAPGVTATPDSSQPIPWSGTHRETSSFSTPSIWPWVPAASSSLTDTIPSGWPSASPPSAVSTTSPSITSSSSSSSGSSSPSGGETAVSSPSQTTAPSRSGQTTLVTSVTTASPQASGSTSATTSVPPAPAKSAAASRLEAARAAALCAVLGSAFRLLI